MVLYMFSTKKNETNQSKRMVLAHHSLFNRVAALPYQFAFIFNEYEYDCECEGKRRKYRRFFDIMNSYGIHRIKRNQQTVVQYVVLTLEMN